MDGNAIEVPTGEIYRYLGYRGLQPEDTLQERVDDCTKLLRARSAPCSVWASYPFTPPARQNKTAPEATNSPDPAASHITIGPLSFDSRALSRNLRDCSQVVLMAATIGPGVDFLIRRAEATSMVDAAIYQAAGAAMVEAWCDMVNARIKEAMQPQGLYARPRFSPGYGDVPLALQRDFASVLNLSKNCGISMTETLLMSPSKSVTAFIGFSPIEERCPLAGCEVCSKQSTCAYRR